MSTSTHDEVFKELAALTLARSNDLANGTSQGLVPCPISSLPSELLSLIFQIANDSTSSRDILVPRIPVIVSLVSRLWRDVAINNPILWSRLTISTPWNPGAIEAILARSKECPLDLQIIVPYLDF